MFNIFQPDMFLPHLIVMVVILGIVLPIHEFAHAYAAYKLGDPTAKYEGRMTLNPIAHLDLVGTILLFFAGIGWGKPVPVNPYNLKSRYGEALVSFAGPLSNLILALILTLIVAFLPSSYHTFGVFNLNTLILLIIKFSVLLGIFNLIPIPPLDGSKILFDFLPPSWENFKRNLERYGPIILLFFFFTQFGGGAFFVLVDSVSQGFYTLADVINGAIY
jgi:Zn-dependent protease